MTALNITQVENRGIYCDPLPCKDTLDRMEELFTVRRRELILIKNRKNQLAVSMEGSDRSVRISNDLAQAEMRLAENLAQIVEVAEHIVSENRAGEIVTA